MIFTAVSKLLHSFTKIRYVKSCLHVAASHVLDIETRTHYNSEMMTIAQKEMGECHFISLVIDSTQPYIYD